MIDLSMVATCRHLNLDSLQSGLAADMQVGIGACETCARVAHGERFLERGVRDLGDQPIVPISPGQSYGDVVPHILGRGFSIKTDPGHPGLRVLCYNDVPCVHISLWRNSFDGPVCLTPADSKPWWQRVVQPDDLCLGLTLDTGQEVKYDDARTWPAMTMATTLRARGSMQLRYGHLLRLR